MTGNRILLAVVPPLMMIGIALTLPGIEQWLAAFGKTAEAQLTLGRIGLALPYVASAAIGLIFLLSAQGSVNIKKDGCGVVAGSGVVIVLAVIREGIRLSQFAGQVPAARSILSYVDPATMTGAAAVLFSGIFALRVAVIGNAAFSRSEPKRIRGKRALHGEAEWMRLPEAEKLFAEGGGIVIGERYRVDRDSTAALSFRADRKSTRLNSSH